MASATCSSAPTPDADVTATEPEPAPAPAGGAGAGAGGSRHRPAPWRPCHAPAGSPPSAASTSRAVTGTGPDGLVRVEDVEALSAPAAPAPTRRSAAPDACPGGRRTCRTCPSEGASDDRRVAVRRAVARKMVPDRGHPAVHRVAPGAPRHGQRRAQRGLVDHGPAAGLRRCAARRAGAALAVGGRHPDRGRSARDRAGGGDRARPDGPDLHRARRPADRRRRRRGPVGGRAGAEGQARPGLHGPGQRLPLEPGRAGRGPVPGAADPAAGERALPGHHHRSGRWPCPAVWVSR